MIEDALFARALIQLYWLMRMGIALIWCWTAIVSWFYFPHADSIALLHRAGVGVSAPPLLALACGLDLLLGILSCVSASQRLWQCQCIIIAVYTSIILVKLPEFGLHPFGPLIKNIAVLACLGYLITIEKYRKWLKSLL